MTAEPIPTAEEVRELAERLSTVTDIACGYFPDVVRAHCYDASKLLTALLSQRDTALKEREYWSNLAGEYDRRSLRLEIERDSAEASFKVAASEREDAFEHIASWKARSETLLKERDEAVQIICDLAQTAPSSVAIDAAHALLSSLQPQGVKAPEREGA